MSYTPSFTWWMFGRKRNHFIARTILGKYPKANVRREDAVACCNDDDDDDDVDDSAGINRG